MRDIFISYRRNGGEALAHLLYERLTARGYDVFLDVKSLGAGRFDENLDEEIGGCTDFLLLLSPDALDACEDPHNWVRREIECAFSYRKKIIPVMMDGFQFPAHLPDSIENLRYYNGPEANLKWFESMIDELEVKYLTAGPKKKKRRGSADRKKSRKEAQEQNTPIFVELEGVECPQCHSQNVFGSYWTSYLISIKNALMLLFMFGAWISLFYGAVCLLGWGLCRIPAAEARVRHLISVIPYIGGGETGQRVLTVAGVLLGIEALLLIISLFLDKQCVKILHRTVQKGSYELGCTCHDCRADFIQVLPAAQVIELHNRETSRVLDLAVLLSTLLSSAVVGLILYWLRKVLLILLILIAVVFLFHLVIIGIRFIKTVRDTGDFDAAKSEAADSLRAVIEMMF